MTINTPKTSGIYQIRHIKNDQKYIGSAVGVKGLYGRWHTHVSLLNRRCHHSIYLQNAWNKYGEGAFVFEIVEHLIRIEDMTDEQWTIHVLSKEQYYLDVILFAHDKDRSLFNKLGYNMCRKAGSTIGHKHSKEACANMSRGQRGHQNFLGGRHTTEAKTKIGKAHLGNQYARGLKHTEENKARMRAANQGEKGPGVKLTEAQVLKICALHTTGEWTIAVLAQKFSVHRSTISRIINHQT